MRSSITKNQSEKGKKQNKKKKTKRKENLSRFAAKEIHQNLLVLTIRPLIIYSPIVYWLNSFQKLAKELRYR